MSTPTTGGTKHTRHAKPSTCRRSGQTPRHPCLSWEPAPARASKRCSKDAHTNSQIAARDHLDPQLFKHPVTILSSGRKLPNMAPHLRTRDRTELSLCTQARCNSLPVNACSRANSYRVQLPTADKTCPLCHCPEPETVGHLLLRCPVLAHTRARHNGHSTTEAALLQFKTATDRQLLTDLWSTRNRLLAHAAAALR